MMNSEIDRETCGKHLREVREYLGFSREEVATYLGVSCSTLSNSNIERGQCEVSDLELKRLAELYQQPVGYFTGDLEFPSSLPEDLAKLAAALSKQDRNELSRFVGYLRARSEVKISSDGPTH